MSWEPIKIQVLNQELRFPDPRTALQGEYAGLVAVGGDLSTERLLLAYRQGIFPWSVNPVTWWSPEPRAIFELDGFRSSRSFAKFLKNCPFTLTHNQAFEEVMRQCAKPGAGREETWVSPEFIRSYSRLNKAGHAHSVECWQDGALVGGIYGVQIGGFFAGESMFHRVDNASKVALKHLLDHLKLQGFRLFDTQVINPATERLGAINIPRESYLARLAEAIALPCKF